MLPEALLPFQNTRSHTRPTWDLPQQEPVIDLVRQKVGARKVLNVSCLSTVRTVLKGIQSLRYSEVEIVKQGVVVIAIYVLTSILIVNM